MVASWHLYFMAILYIVAGLNHYRVPKLYLKIIPEQFPFKPFLNYASGLLEIVFGILLLIPVTQTYGAWGICVLLILIFPANLYMYANEKASLGIPKFLRLARLPLQVALLFWAYQYT
jgi:uncharacterized membrane protein